MSPIILLHGALGSAAQFDRLRAAIGSTHETIAIDFEGHGNAPDSGRPYSLASFAGNVLDALDERGLERASLFGHSMGGYVALYLALAHQDRVARVCTLATKLAWTPEFATSESAKLFADVIASKVPSYAALLERRHIAFDWKLLLPKIAAFLYDLGATNPLPPKRLAGIPCPVCIAVGDRDGVVTMEESMAAYGAIAGARLEVLSDTPHPYEKMDVDRLAALVNDFFRADEMRPRQS